MSVSSVYRTIATGVGKWSGPSHRAITIIERQLNATKQWKWLETCENGRSAFECVRSVCAVCVFKWVGCSVGKLDEQVSSFS